MGTLTISNHPFECGETLRVVRGKAFWLCSAVGVFPSRGCRLLRWGNYTCAEGLLRHLWQFWQWLSSVCLATHLLAVEAVAGEVEEVAAEAVAVDTWEAVAADVWEAVTREVSVEVARGEVSAADPV